MRAALRLVVGTRCPTSRCASHTSRAVRSRDRRRRCACCRRRIALGSSISGSLESVAQAAAADANVEVRPNGNVGLPPDVLAKVRSADGVTTRRRDGRVVREGATRRQTRPRARARHRQRDHRDVASSDRSEATARAPIRSDSSCPATIAEELERLRGARRSRSRPRPDGVRSRSAPSWRRERRRHASRSSAPSASCSSCSIEATATTRSTSKRRIRMPGSSVSRKRSVTARASARSRSGPSSSNSSSRARTRASPSARSSRCSSGRSSSTTRWRWRRSSGCRKLRSCEPSARSVVRSSCCSSPKAACSGSLGARSVSASGYCSASRLLAVQGGALEEIYPIQITKLALSPGLLAAAAIAGVLARVAAALLPARRIARADPAPVARPDRRARRPDPAPARGSRPRSACALGGRWRDGIGPVPAAEHGDVAGHLRRVRPHARRHRAAGPDRSYPPSPAGVSAAHTLPPHTERGTARGRRGAAFARTNRRSPSVRCSCRSRSSSGSRSDSRRSRRHSTPSSRTSSLRTSTSGRQRGGRSAPTSRWTIVSSMRSRRSTVSPQRGRSG